jgi:hypothetical protein
VTTLNLAYYLGQLTAVNAAITKIYEGGQDLSESDKRITRGRLADLQKERGRLEKIIAGLEGNGSPLIRNYGIRKR